MLRHRFVWKRLSIASALVYEPHARDAHLVFELELLQPQAYAPNTLGQRTLYPQDIHGTAWFDDITISQIPRVRLTTDHAGNLFRRSEPMTLTMDVNDAFIEDLAAVIPLQHLELVREILAGQEVEKRAAQIDWDRARKTLRPPQEWFDDTDNPFAPEEESAP